MKIRLIGPAEECAAVVETLRDQPTLNVAVSSTHPCNDDPTATRIYVDARFGTRNRSGHVVRAAVPRPDPDIVGIRRAMRWAPR